MESSVGKSQEEEKALKEEEELKQPPTKKLKRDHEEDQEAKSYIDNLKLASFEPLKKMDKRTVCPLCKQSRKYYCYNCYAALNEDVNEIPLVELPIKVTVLRHPKEKISKSSIVPAKVLSPNQVEIRHELDPLPVRTEDQDYDSVVLLFPSADAKEVVEMGAEELGKIKEVVLIDCTWNQTAHFLKQKNIQMLKKVKIQTEKTVFWRYQSCAETNLATIEAMYFFFRDFEVAQNCGKDYGKYSGKYDNLLYYYAFTYRLIQSAYTEGNRKDASFHRIEGYIK